MPVYNAFCGLTGANLCLVARLTNRLQQIIDNTSLRCFICRSLKKGDRMKKVIMWAGMDLPIPF